jgi:hypothetical protein
MKSDFVQQSDIAFGAQLNLMATGLPGYATVLGVAAETLAAVLADDKYFDYCLKSQAILQHAAREATYWRDIMRGGGPLPPTGAPVAPVLPEPPTAVNPGIESRYRSLAKVIKGNKNYNAAIGTALGIEGSQQSGPDLTTIQPVIRVYVSGNAVLVDWGWQGYSAWLDLCELQADRGDGKGYVPLAFDTTPGYTDTAPFPTTPVKWTYRAIYRVGDAQVGVWSAPVSITVPA